MNDRETAGLMQLLKFGPRTLQQLGATDSRRPPQEEERDGFRIGCALQRLHYANLTTINGDDGFRITNRGEMVAQRIAVEAARREASASTMSA